jgi:hypothetical protein
MIRHLAKGVKHLFGLHRPGRILPVFRDDILLASYPQSGCTALQFLLANLFHPDREVNFDNLRQVVLDVDVSTKRDFDRSPRPRIMNTHSGFDARYRRVIYLVRDPRDVAQSRYETLRKLRKIDDQLSIADFIDRFLAGRDVKERAPQDDSGSWGENVGSWMAVRFSHPGFLWLRYEDLVADAERELKRVADFLGLPTDPKKISQAIERSSLAPLVDKRNELPEAQVASIEAAWGDIMACLGYKLTTRDPGDALKSSLIALLMSDGRGKTGTGNGNRP